MGEPPLLYPAQSSLLVLIASIFALCLAPRVAYDQMSPKEMCRISSYAKQWLFSSLAKIEQPAHIELEFEVFSWHNRRVPSSPFDEFLDLGLLFLVRAV